MEDLLVAKEDSFHLLHHFSQQLHMHIGKDIFRKRRLNLIGTMVDLEFRFIIHLSPINPVIGKEKKEHLSLAS